VDVIKAHGDRNAFSQLIHQNVRQAHYLAGLVTKHPRLELLAPAPLNVVCFRFVVPAPDDAALNALNTEILLRIQESGAGDSLADDARRQVRDRVAITNHRSPPRRFRSTGARGRGNGHGPALWGRGYR